MARPLALAAAIAVALLAFSGAGGAVAQPTPKRGGSVVVPGGPEPACLNPFGNCDFDATSPWVGEVLEGAFEVAPDSSYRPSLVSRADIVSKRPFVVMYRIRPQARWSDGVPVTTADFVFTRRVFLEHRVSAVGTVDLRPAYRSIRRVVPLDAKSFRIVFRERFADWRTLFEHVLPSHVLAGRDITAVWRTRIDDPRTGRPIGSGPFLTGGWERGKEITLVRDPHYWGTHAAYLDWLEARFPEPGLSGPVEAIRDHHRDVLALIGADPAVTAALLGVTGVTVKSAAMPSLEYLVLRLASGGQPALENRLVRQAVAYGLDRSAIARVRTGDARLQADNDLLPKNSRFYRPNWSMYRFNPARARRLLEQAGCRRGTDAIYVCGGQRLSLRFLTTAGNATRQRTLELIQTELRESGIEARPAYAPTITEVINVLRTGDFDFALVNTLGSTGRIPGPYCDGLDENWTGYCNRLTNRDLLDANVSVDERQRARALNEADAKLARDVPVIPLAALPFTLAYRSNIRGIVLNPVNPLWHAENWWLVHS